MSLSNQHAGRSFRPWAYLSTALVVSVAAAMLLLGAGASVPPALELPRGGRGVSSDQPNLSSAAQNTIVLIEPLRKVIRVVDTGSGLELATVGAGSGAAAVIRGSASELLVSSILPSVSSGPGDASFRNSGRLQILDLTDGLNSKWELQLPDRLDYALYAPLMRLSGDESHLYYAARSQRNIPECSQGGDAALCDQIGVGIVDLVARSVLFIEEMPIGCGWPALSPAADEFVVAACTGAPVAFLIGPSGIVKSAAFELSTQPKGSAAKGGLRPILGFLTPGGELGVVTERGSIHIQEGGRVRTYEVLPAGASPAPRGQAAVVDANRLMIPYRRGSSQLADGAVIFDLKLLQASNRILAPALWVEFVDGDLVAITAAGTVARTNPAGVTTSTAAVTHDETAALAR